MRNKPRKIFSYDQIKSLGTQFNGLDFVLIRFSLQFCIPNCDFNLNEYHFKPVAKCLPEITLVIQFEIFNLRRRTHF